MRDQDSLGAMSILVAILLLIFCPLAASGLFADYHHQNPRPLAPGAIAVNAPGNFAVAGATYQLLRDISSATSPIFLGKDVTLDLNGHIISFADGGYANIPNYDFENGLNHWETSGAPRAKIEPDKVQVFTGKHVLRLSQGEKIVSEYINLPVANRSYFAMCGVASSDMRVSLFIEDRSGNAVQCFNVNGDSTRQCCPMINRSPRLGGGFVTVHLYGQPAGQYRVRVRAETDCLIDHIDLRPAMDVGISIVEKTQPTAHNDDLYNGKRPAFFDFTAPGSQQEPIADITRVTGSGTVTIKNGIIQSGALGVLSWGIQSTAQDVHIILDDVKTISSGINTNAVDAPSATITNCLFEINTPFIINRHVSEHAVVLRGSRPSKVSFSEFYGGQGCLTIKGENSDVHDNLFVNRQTVTNHYSIMAMGDGSKIHHNLFKPEIGSGVEIYRHKDIQIFENEFHIQAAPPTCEYGHEEYSTTAIRVADYGAEPGSERGCDGNRIFNNKFFITGKDYPDYPDYIPMAWAFFHSVSGGDTYIYDNDIFVDHTAPDSKAEAAAIYIGGSQNGGVWENNRITTNVPAAWIASRYGGAAKAKFINNSIVLSPGVKDTVKPFFMGWAEREDCIAQNIHFDSNEFINTPFAIDKTDQPHSFSVYWTLTLRLLNSKKTPNINMPIVIVDVNEFIVAEKSTDDNGEATFCLQEFRFERNNFIFSSPFTIKAAGKQWQVKLDQNKKIDLVPN